MLENKLSQLGLSSKEIKIFLSLLRVGPMAASTLARLTQIKRSSVYDVINKLMEQGLVSEFKQAGHSYFMVDDPKKLELHAKEQLRLAHELTPQLQGLQNTGQQMQVQYYKGKEGYRSMYEHILEVKPKEALVWIDLEFMHRALDPRVEGQWTAKRIQLGAQARLIAQDTPHARKLKAIDASSRREIRLIPKDQFPFEATCVVYGDFLAFFDSKQDVTGVRIHNPELAQMQRQIFEMNWRGLAPQRAS